MKPRYIFTAAVALAIGLPVVAGAQTPPQPNPPVFQAWSYEVRSGDTTMANVAQHIAGDVGCASLTAAEAAALATKINDANDRPTTLRIGLILQYDPTDVTCRTAAAPTTTVAPTTTCAPTTTVAPSTTRAPTTTVAPSTTRAPTTTVAPSTTRAPTTTVAPPADLQFFEGFDSAAGLSRFALYTEFTPNHGFVGSGGINPDTWGGDHSMACQVPDPGNQRTISAHSPAEWVYYCAPGNDPANGHFMTSFINAEFAMLSLTPKQTFQNVSQVCWDINLTEFGGRRWYDMLLVSEAEYQSAVTAGRVFWDPAAGDTTEHGGRPLPTGSMMGFFDLGTFDMHTDNSSDLRFITGPFGSTDVSTRYHHCMTDNGNGTITVTRDNPPGIADVNMTVPGHFPDGAVRLVIQDKSYDLQKSLGADTAAGRNTFHWDNITVR